jgi:hypothetical protein
MTWRNIHAAPLFLFNDACEKSLPRLICSKQTVGLIKDKNSAGFNKNIFCHKYLDKLPAALYLVGA